MRIARYLWISFVGSIAVITMERGVYFLTKERLHFGDAANLWLALLVGLAYVLGSLTSHRASVRWGEKRTFGAILSLQLGLHLAMGLWPLPACVFLLLPLASVTYGMQWPILESYVSAGHGPAASQRVVGLFNLSWALAVPLTLAVAGPLIAWWLPALFLLAALLNVVILVAWRAVPATPPRLPHDHPERPAAGELARLRALLAGHRWLLVLSYSAMFVLAPLIPSILARLEVPVAWGAGISGLLDLVRVVAFAALWQFTGWHGRRWPVYSSALLLPVGFFVTLFARNLGMVLAGELLFGLAMGLIYYGALHYALLIENAAVDAGGAHEGVIGTGFALGPAVGLLALGLEPALGGQTAAMLAGLGPLFVWCSYRACRAAARA